jgi:Acetyltransferase (GNAT) domain
MLPILESMQGRCLAVRGLSADTLEAWRDLAGRALEPNPLCEPSCVLPAATHLQDGGDIEIVVAEEAGRLFGCCPVRPVSRTGQLPMRAFTTDVRRMTYLGTPLVDASRSREACRVMFDALMERRRSERTHLFHVKWLHGGGPVDLALRGALDDLGLPVYVAESFDRPLVRRRLEATYDEGFNSKYRSVLRRRLRQLEKEVGGPVTVENVPNRPGVLDLLVDLEARGYKGRSGVAMAGVPGEVEQFTDMCERFGEEGRLQVLTLEGNGHVAAMQLSLRGGPGLFALKVTYDEALGAFGPGVQMQLGAIEYFHEHTDADWIDSCTYEGNEPLLRSYPDRLNVVSYVIPLGGALPSALVRALPTVRRARQRIDAIRDRRSGAGSEKEKEKEKEDLAS